MVRRPRLACLRQSCVRADTVGLVHPMRMNKRSVEVQSLTDESSDVAYWRSRTPAERLEAVEHLRQLNYGYDPAAARLQRILEIAQLASS